MIVTVPGLTVMRHLTWRDRCGSIREVMRIGFHLTPFWSPTDRPPTRIIDEAIEVVAAASRMGFAWVSIGQHWLSHPTVWPQPFPMLARLAPETGAMRLKTSVLLLPILNPVEVAESVATLDHICHGRLDVGVAIGYREAELATAGPGARRPRGQAGRVAGRHEAPVARRDGGLRRALRARFAGAARLHAVPDAAPAARDGRAERERHAPGRAPHRRRVLRPPARLGRRRPLRRVFREARAAAGVATPGFVGASRSLIVGTSKEAAASAARAYLEKTFAMYRTWQMQEPTMGRLQLGFEASLDDWTIHGSPKDCVETIERARALGVERIGFSIYSLPTEAGARIDYLQMIASEIVARVRRPA